MSADLLTKINDSISGTLCLSAGVSFPSTLFNLRLENNKKEEISILSESGWWKLYNNGNLVVDSSNAEQAQISLKVLVNSSINKISIEKSPMSILIEFENDYRMKVIEDKDTEEQLLIKIPHEQWFVINNIGEVTKG